MRTMLVWRSATRLPTVIDERGQDPDAAHQAWPPLPFLPKKPKKTILIRATKPPAFDATDRKAVTGVGAPS